MMSAAGVELDCIGYYDQKGAVQEIYLPPGSLGTACGCVENEKWDEKKKLDTCSTSPCPATGYGH